ncbi:bifunctional riboflavin kinase/FAD synthetase [Aureliella helgolandensis]|uniref:Riboflavin biosynthesis protein n=1 Tax=Aureliella helgolandensis TaxID=2527968 RepID=A0A518GFV5_9BACT|nr:bifunctional riboflavin kinase/FAD synthetase [Aureliella helgolandensis]QDV27479.1 Riboflavin kinase [Aureliella helgolandensis]
MPPTLIELHEIPPELLGCAVAIGNFDGVHRGHTVLIRQLIELARRHSGPAIVVTFDPPPSAILLPDRPASPPLTPLSRRAELLQELGVAAVVPLKTTPQLLSLSAEEFFEQTIRSKLKASAMAEGPNFRFGHNRKGDTNLLQELCQASQIELCIVAATSDSGGMVSSTRIRELIAAGELSAANQMLTQPYQLQGVVQPGAQRGRELGFPTANLAEIKSLLPGHGVYAGRVQLHSKEFRAAINIGPNPTFAEDRVKVEVHLIGFSGELYGQELRCQVLTKVRDVQRFDSFDALKQQIAIDVTRCESFEHSTTSQ